MSGIVLSSSVRQNLLSLQSTASLLATTQNDLATGNKVNSALDNPTNFFTAQSLNNRASDIGNLLDGIGNGVQVLQAANTGITSLQSLVASAQSIANQALQTTVGYSTLSNVSTTITGATASNLLGTTTFTNAVASSNVLYSGNAGGTTAATSSTKLGGVVGVLTGATLTSTTANSLLNGSTTAGDLNAGVAAGDSFTVNGKTVTFAAGDAPGTAPTGFTQVAAVANKTTGNVFTDASGNSIIYLGNTGAKASAGDVTTAIDIASGAQSNVAGTLTLNSGQTASTSAGKLILDSSTGADLNISGKADFLNKLGLTASLGSGTVSVTAARTTATGTAGNLIQDGSTLNVDGHVITFKNAPAPGASASHTGVNGAIETDGNGNSTVYLQTATVGDLTNAIDLATGAQTATLGTSGATLKTASGAAVSSINTSGQLQISTGLNADLSITGTGNALSALGLGGNTGTATSFTAARGAGTGGITGKTLTFSSFNGGTAVNVTFGTGAGQVQTLNDLNTALQADNLNATLDANGVLKISAANDYASSTLGSTQAGGAIGGTLTSALNFSSASAPVADAAAQATRANLVQQYNNVLQQINTTAQDSSFNGVNLLNGDQLKLVFNETGKSTLNITGVTFNSAGLGLSNLVQGSDFIDNNATNKVLANLTAASTTLRSEASSLGSNLSIVQIRQDFSKNIINVLQTGSSNLTLADTNEEAANSQALSTRQSIAVSALALANQSQQSVLQLLR
jgi:flagellin-like hook-associated protein FlgL